MKDLQKSLSDNYKSIDALNQSLELKSKQILTMQSTISCLQEFQESKSENQAEIERKLVEARGKYDLYKINMSKDRIDTMLTNQMIYEVISTYENYKGRLRETECSGIKLSYFHDNLIAEDYLILARIYGHNEGNIVDQTPGSINEVTNKFLLSVGNALEKGFYDNKSEVSSMIRDFYNILDNIGTLAIVDRRPDSVNSEILSNYNSIISLYKQKKYLQALFLYDKYAKFNTSEVLKSHKIIVDEVKYCVGSILLWNMANLDSSGNFLMGNWIQNATSYRQRGIEILKSLLEQKDLHVDIRKKCLIALKKFYA